MATDWKAERRADRAADAEQRRADEAQRHELARADQAAAAKLARAERDRRTARRAAARTAATAWVRGHVLDLLFVPVIVVPGVLAWSAMAAYGQTVFGPVGIALPLFSEAAMWAFAFATALARQAGRPTGWLTVGVWTFAGMAAGLNFVHGLDVPGGGVYYGTVMALVSIGGVIVHQLVTAIPARRRRTRAERTAARLAHRAERRIDAVRRAAVRGAVADLAPDGSARLVYRPGLVAYDRPFWRRARLLPATVPGLPVAASDGAQTVGEDLAAEIAEYLTGLPAGASGGNGGNTPGTAQTPDTGPPVEPVPAAIAKRLPRLLARARAGIDTGKLAPRPTRTEVQKYLRVRAEVAVAVTHALHSNDDGPTPMEVPA
jgi:hypothetical protein